MSGSEFSPEPARVTSAESSVQDPTILLDLARNFSGIASAQTFPFFRSSQICTPVRFWHGVFFCCCTSTSFSAASQNQTRLSSSTGMYVSRADTWEIFSHIRGLPGTPARGMLALFISRSLLSACVSHVKENEIVLLAGGFASFMFCTAVVELVVCSNTWTPGRTGQ